MKVDSEYLDELIDKKGIKKCAIAMALGITPGSFYNKSHNVTEFTFAEAQILFEVLSASDEEQKKIFVQK